MQLISKNRLWQATSILFTSLSLSLLFFVSTASAQPWQLIRDEQNVQVYKQSRSGELDRFLVQTQVKASAHAILSLLQDMNNNPNWVENSLGVKLIKQLSRNENIIQTRLQAPWPFKNRELINYSRNWQDRRNCGLFIDIKAMPNAVKKHPDYQRVTQFQANWTSYPISKTHVLIRYSGWLDPGGYIPELLSSHVAQHSLFTTFVNMRQQIIKPKYQKLRWGLQDLSPCIPQSYYINALGK